MGKKILITSIPCWNQISGSDTLSSLFRPFDREDLANIYISPDMPDSDVCSRYFNIREWQVVRSVYRRNVTTGIEVKNIDNSIDPSTIQQEQKLTKHFSKRRRRVFLWLREMAWKLGKWKSKELDAFLEDFNPEVLVFPVESYPYFNRINEYIIKKCKPKKIIGYLWDDNFSYKQHPNSYIFKIERYFLRKQVRRLVHSCTDILAISPKMKQECDAEFGINSIVVTKPILSVNPFQPYTVKSPINLLYTGKLNIGRDQSLLTLIGTLENSMYTSSQIHIDIYTNTLLSDFIKNQIEKSSFCTIHPPVAQCQVIELQKKADILLFLESLTNDDLTARLSFSTKLTDYFAAGKCVWAIGNRDLGPISYLRDENAGIVSTSSSEVESALSLIIEKPYFIQEYALRAYNCGCNNHNYDLVVSNLKKAIG